MAQTGTERRRPEAEGLTAAQARANVKARSEAHEKEKGKFAGVDTDKVRSAYVAAKAAYQAARAQLDKLQDNVKALVGLKTARQNAFKTLHARAMRVRRLAAAVQPREQLARLRMTRRARAHPRTQRPLWAAGLHLASVTRGSR